MSHSSEASDTEPFMAKQQKGDYDKLQLGDEEEEDIEMIKPKSRRIRRLSTAVSLLWKTLVICFALWGAVSISRNAVSKFRSANKVTCHCGSSVAEARQLECKYDSLSTSWLPPQCRDDELTAEFDSSGPGPNGEWTYFQSNATNARTYTLEEVANSADNKAEKDRQFWVTTDWHTAHCFFYWRKVERAALLGTHLEYTGFADEKGHAYHCTQMFLKHLPPEMVVVWIFTGFGDPDSP